jgi:hypothetical protein
MSFVKEGSFGKKITPLIHPPPLSVVGVSNKINKKPLSFVLGVPLPIKNSRLDSKILAQLFSRMSYDFHDIKHIVHPYIDELPAHSM